MVESGQRTTKRSPLRQLWTRLTAPSPLLTDAEARERSTVLAGVLIVLLTGLPVFMLVLWLLVVPSTTVSSPHVSLLVALFLVCAASYVLNRRGRYRVATVVLIGWLFLVILLAADLMLSGIMRPFYGQHEAQVLMYLAIPLALTAVLLPRSYWMLALVVALVSFLLLLVRHADLDLRVLLHGPVLFLFAVLGLLILVGYLLTSSRREVYRQLAEREERYRSLFEQSPDAVFLVTNDGIVEAMNRSGQALFGYEQEEMVGQHIRIVYANPNERSAVIARADHEGHVRDEPLRLIRSDGSVMDCVVTIHQRIDVRGRRAGYQTIVRDVTERVRSEEELRLKGALLDNAHDAILLVEPGGEIVYANEAAAQMTGYATVELTGMNVRHLNTEEGAGQVPTRISRMMREGGLGFETVWVRKDGGHVDVEVKTRTIESQGRTLFLSVARDVSQRKADEAALRLRGELLDSAHDAVFLYDLKGKIVYVNDAAARQRGYSRDELMRMNMRGIDTAEGDGLFRRRVSEIVAEGTLTFEGRHVRKDGSTVPVEVQARTIESEGRIFVLAIARDIGERKKAEAAVRASEEKFRTLFEQSIDAISISRPDGTDIEANSAWLALFGYERSELVRLNFRDLYANVADRDSFLEAIEAKGFLEDEVRLKKKDGTEFICRRSAVARRNDEGVTILYQGVFHDVTEERRAEQQLRDSEARFRALVDHTGLAMTLTTVEGTVLECNEVFPRMLGYTIEEVLGMRSIEVYARPEDRDRLIAHVVRHGYLRGVEVEFRRKDGGSVFVSLTSALVSQGEGLLIISQSLDITERKAFERELEASREELRKLAAYLEDAREKERTGIARELHDQLGQALTALGMDLDGVRRAVDEGERVSVERLQRMDKLLEDTVDDVRRISSELRPGILDDVGLLAALEWQLDQFSSRSGVESTLEARSDDADLERPQVTALFRVFQEILTNVARHADASRVWVEFDCVRGNCSLTVSDNGRGISSGEMDDPSSLGIIGMKERLRPFRGDTQFSGRAGGGTVVRVSMPV